MTILNITKAVRKGAHVIIALYGYSGSGKTLSALLLARGLAGKDGKICMIDTESGRGMIYAQAVPGGYDYAELTPPFTPERYTEAFAEVEATGAKVVIVDSSSHEWAGIGGIVEMADSGKSQAGVPLQGLVKWAGPKARHKRWIAALLQSHMHVILCVRAKEKLVQKGSGPRAEIVSEGMVPIQEKGFIFETTVQVLMHHEANRRATYTVEKCPGDLLSAFPEGQKISVATGERIAEWVSGGAPVDHELETLKRAGEQAAEGGKDAFGKWWNEPAVKRAWDRLRPFLDNFRSIALTADEERTRQTERAEEPPGDPADPFASRPANGTNGTTHADAPLPASPLSVKGKAREEQWGVWLPALKRTLMAAPKAERKAMLEKLAKEEYEYLKQPDVDAIEAILDAPE